MNIHTSQQHKTKCNTMFPSENVAYILFICHKSIMTQVLTGTPSHKHSKKDLFPKKDLAI